MPPGPRRQINEEINGLKADQFRLIETKRESGLVLSKKSQDRARWFCSPKPRTGTHPPHQVLLSLAVKRASASALPKGTGWTVASGPSARTVVGDRFRAAGGVT